MLYEYEYDHEWFEMDLAKGTSLFDIEWLSKRNCCLMIDLIESFVLTFVVIGLF